MNWDYLTFIQQPEWFIVAIRTRMKIESEYHQRELRKQQAQQRRS